MQSYLELGKKLLPCAEAFGWAIIYFSLAIAFLAVIRTLHSWYKSRKTTPDSERSSHLQFLPSIALFCGIASGAMVHLYDRRETESALVCFILAGAMFLVYSIFSQLELPGLALKSWQIWTLIGLFLLIALFMRTHRLGTYPEQNINDYAANSGNGGKEFMMTGNYSMFWPMRKGTLYDSKHCPFYIIPMSWIFRVKGVNPGSLRMLDIPISLAIILMVFLLLRKQFSLSTGLLGAWWLVVMPWHVAYSRTGLYLGATILVALLIMYLWLMCVEKGKWWLYVILGVLLAITGYFYAPIRVLPIVVIVALVAGLIWQRERNWREWLKVSLTVILFGTIFFIEMGGLEQWNKRIALHDGSFATDTVIWRRDIENKVHVNYTGISPAFKHFLDNIKVAYRLVLDNNRIMPWYQTALLFGLVGSIPWIGCRWVRMWWLVTLASLLPSLIVYPSYRRMLILIPCTGFWLALLSGLVVVEIRRLIPVKWLYQPLLTVFIIWLALLSPITTQLFFSGWTQSVFRCDVVGGGYRMEFLNKVAEHLGSYYIYLVNMGHRNIVHEFMLFDSVKTLDTDPYYLSIETRHLGNLTLPNDKPIVFAFLDERRNTDVPKELQKLYPGGRMETGVTSKDQNHKYYFYYLGEK